MLKQIILNKVKLTVEIFWNEMEILLISRAFVFLIVIAQLTTHLYHNKFLNALLITDKDTLTGISSVSDNTPKIQSRSSTKISFHS